MTRSEILKEIIHLEMLLEDIRLGLRPSSTNEELGLRDDLRALRDKLCDDTLAELRGTHL